MSMHIRCINIEEKWAEPFAKFWLIILGQSNLLTEYVKSYHFFQQKEQINILYA